MQGYPVLLRALRSSGKSIYSFTVKLNLVEVLQKFIVDNTGICAHIIIERESKNKRHFYKPNN